MTSEAVTKFRAEHPGIEIVANDLLVLEIQDQTEAKVSEPPSKKIKLSETVYSFIVEWQLPHNTRDESANKESTPYSSSQG